MYRAVQAKFTQNTTLRAILCDSGDSQLAESSTDQYWGTCLHLHDRNVLNSRQWKNKEGGQRHRYYPECAMNFVAENPAPLILR